MKVKIMFDKKRFNNKPTGYETGGVQNRIVATEIELNELAVGLSNGCTFKPALLNGSKSESWIQQQVFALDFDHNADLEIDLKKAKDLGIEPCFIYTTFSHSEKEHKFRMVFVTDKVITDIEMRNKLQITLVKTFANSDDVTIDETRMFYGGKGKEPYYFDYDARINAEDIISRFYKEGYSIPTKKEKVYKPRDSKDANITYDTSYMINIEAIKSLNVDVLRGLISSKLEVTPNKEDNNLLLSGVVSSNIIEIDTEKGIYDYINQIDMNLFTGIGEGYIQCILPEHEDNTPSAHIYTTDDGTQVYKCFGCNRVFTIIGLVERLARCKRSKAIEFIKNVYNLKLVQSEWVKEQKQLMIDSANYLDTEEFKIQFPELSKLIKKRKIHIQKMLMHFTQYISDNLSVDGKPLFFGSYSTLMEVCGIHKNSRLVFSQSLTLFNLLNMLEKVETEKIPEEELKKAKSIAAKYGHKKLTNFYQFEEYGVNTLYDSENIAKKLKENNISLRGLSREYILRTFGRELADKVFPQFKYENEQGTSKRSDDRTINLATKIMATIEQYGYCLESSIKENKHYELQWKKSIQEILDSYDLVKVKASKINKLKYDIPNDIPYQCNVVCKNIE